MIVLSHLSLRARLLFGILIPVFLFIVFDTQQHYHNALQAVNVAYDRTLLASAKSIGDQLSLVFVNGQPHVRANVQYSSLEVFQTDVLSRFAYRVSDSKHTTIDGDADLPTWTGQLPHQSHYAALVDFYDDIFRGDPVRVAVLLQPLATPQGSTMVTIQVAETLELRQLLARNMLIETLLSQLGLAAFIAIVTLLVVQWSTRSVRLLQSTILSRDAEDLSPIEDPHLPKELIPLLTATNHAMGRLQAILANQKRFIRDTSHQLRTPLAVLKTQVQSALRGDIAPLQALKEISQTVDRASQLANQMLALAKVAQVAQQNDKHIHDWALLVREVVVDLSPLIADKNLNFDIETMTSPIQAHTWMLKELTRNLLHNAIKFAPTSSNLSVALVHEHDDAQLIITDQGPGLLPEIQNRLFQPFATGNPQTGTGLGLSICHEIVQSLSGNLRLINQMGAGLRCQASLPLANQTVPSLPNDPTA